MAPRPPRTEPPGTPPTPAFVARDGGHGEPAFQFTCDDYGSGPGEWDVDKPGLAASPRSGPAAFLHPQHATSLRPSTPDSAFAMAATEDGLANGGFSASPPKKNPFNFQTQFISTAPVKSVRSPPRPTTPPLSLHASIVIRGAADESSNAEHWTATRPPLQAQLHKRATPDLSGTAPATAPRPPRLPAHPDL
jgi:hypothetical protein